MAEAGSAGLGGPGGPKPKIGPEPTLLSRTQVDALYKILSAVTEGLDRLRVPYIMTGGSLLGAIRQKSILFCDDDIDLAIVEESSNSGYYELVRDNLPAILGEDFQYSTRPWEGGDRVRLKECSNCFLDVFTLREYETKDDLIEVIGKKRNGSTQPDKYISDLFDLVQGSLHSQGECQGDSFPLWHFNTRKAIELWPKESYRQKELFPLRNSLEMGPAVSLSGPHLPIHVLKRAFGADCFEVYYQSISHGMKAPKNKMIKEVGMNEALPPVVRDGGQWRRSEKRSLTPEHYIPMQPTLKSKRRHTTHCKDELFEFLSRQEAYEKEWLRSHGILPKACRPKTVYLDGVFDLFHVGHLNAIKQAANLGDRLIVGVTGDDDATGYKRKPIISQAERTEIIQSLEYVDETVCPCPLLVTEDFMRQRNIDLVVHGFADAADEQRQRKEFFEIAIRENKFRQIEYYRGQSTSDIIAQIERCKDDAPVRNGINPKWFGASLAAATDKSPHIQYDPFPLNLRVSIDIHLRKAARRRTEALAVSREAAGSAIYDSVLSSFRAFSQEGEFHFDTSKHMLRDRFLHSCNLPENFDLAMLHTSDEPGLKDTMLLALMDNFRAFQREFDVFAREVACVKVASMADEPVNELYYQSFPCVRIIRPGDFSIGPHCDSAYGHHPCSINIYVPLTKIEGTSSLFLESRPGSEDWHPIEGTYGFGKHFAGAVCNHWTPENNTNFTRVSFDFRIIPGHLFRALDCGSDKSGDAKDVYRQREGYYSRCVLDESTSSWIRDDDGPLNTPDSRCGFPWTARKEGR